MSLTFQEVSPLRLRMPKQVLLVRGGALASNTGIGGAHHNLVTSLVSGEIAGWSTQEVCEYPLRRRMNPLSRLYKRWFSHPKKVEKKTRGEHGLNLLHITDQEQAHLIPENCSVPTVVTVHDLFHLFPQQIRIGNETIDVGEQNPGWFRRKDLQKLRDGLSRADLLVCDSQATLSACKEHFPKVKSVCVPLGLRVPSFAPVSQESGEVLSPARNFSKKCHLLIVGSHAPRKRLEFLCQVLGGLEKDVKENIHIHHVGNEHCPYGGPSASIHARANNVLNWTSHGGDVSSEALMQMRFASEEHAARIYTIASPHWSEKPIFQWALPLRPRNGRPACKIGRIDRR